MFMANNLCNLKQSVDIKHVKHYFIQIEEALIQRKKMELLQKYVSDDLQAEEEESKKMLGL